MELKRLKLAESSVVCLMLTAHRHSYDNWFAMYSAIAIYKTQRNNSTLRFAAAEQKLQSFFISRSSI